MWRNIAHLEESLSLPELQAVLDASREREYRANKFAAALKGVDLDNNGENAKDKFEEVQRRVEAKLAGKSQESTELDELAFDFEVEE